MAERASEWIVTHALGSLQASVTQERKRWQRLGRTIRFLGWVMFAAVAIGLGWLLHRGCQDLAPPG